MKRSIRRDGAKGRRAFYCRHDNRVLPACPRAADVDSCPLRFECSAAVEAAGRSREAASR